MLLYRQREIVAGPGLFKFNLALIDREKIPVFSVRGVNSDCECRPYGNSCDQCRHVQHLGISLIGYFVAPNRGVLFWGIAGIVSLNPRYDMEFIHYARSDYEEGKSIPSEQIDFVYGKYDPTTSTRGWVASCKLFLRDHFTALYNDSLVRPAATYEDFAEGRAPYRNFQGRTWQVAAIMLEIEKVPKGNRN